jgi:LEA14-like dessication related protein
MQRSLLLLVFAALTLCGCATLSQRDPMQVTVAGIEPLKGEGLELRLIVKLRVQNPNDAPLDYDGVYVKVDVQDRTFATGVSDERGSVPRFGEAIVNVPLTVSMFRIARQVMGMRDGESIEQIRYSMSGKLHGSTFGSQRFESKGEFNLKPPEPAVVEDIN